jgi:hypothetical protein
MKELPCSDPKAWENRILKDLSFIKKHSRYPISRKTLAPTLFLGIFVLFIARFGWAALTFKNNDYVFYFIITLLLITIVVTTIRYLSSIRFATIHTPFFVQENQLLLKKFMEAEHLAYSRHPEAVEVFQIISKNISFNSEQREVMVFIADDKRILVNSHFTNQKFSIMPPSKHYRQMAKKLHQWLQSQNVNDNRGIISVNN